MKRILLLVIAVTLMMLFLTGCKATSCYPRIKLANSQWSSVIYLDVANRSTFDHYERFDDENETKIVLYFNKRKEE